MLTPLALILTVMWLSWTVLVDFCIVPTVFQSIPDFFVAGNLGVALFTQLNRLEFPLASVLLGVICLHTKHTGAQKPLVLVSFVLVGIAGLYLFSLTPKLSALSATWEYAEKMGTLGPGGQDIQALHQSYHRTYIILDTVKLLLLLTQMISLGVFLSRRPR